MTPTKFIIAIDGIEKMRQTRMRRPVKLYVTNVSYDAKRDGFSITGFGYSRDKTTATEFGKLTAQKISQQLNSPRFRSLKSTVEEA